MTVRGAARFFYLRTEPGNPEFPTLPDGVRVAHVTVFGAGSGHTYSQATKRRQRFRQAPRDDAQRFAGWQDLTTWVKPGTVDFGIIPVAVQRTVSLYNARPSQITLTAISLPAGVTVASPGLPIVLEPYDGVDIVLEASPEGDPSFDGTITFTTSVGDVTARTIGSRLFTIEVSPQRPIIESVNFRTAVLRSKDATEVPYGLLRAPNSRIDYVVRFDSDLDRIRFRNNFMSGASQLVVGAQKWYEARRTTAAATALDTVIQVPTANGSFVVDQPISIVTPDGVSVLASVASFDASSITLANALGTAIPAGSELMPVGLGYVSKFPEYRTFPVNAEDTKYQVTFNRQRSFAALSGDFPIFDTLPIVEECNEIRGPAQRGKFERTEETLDSGLSNRISFNTFPLGEHVQRFDLTLDSAASIWKWRQFVEYLDGSYGLFWVPTFRNDVTGVSIPTPDVTFDADNTGLAIFNQAAPREALRFKYPDGTIEYREIGSVTDNGALESVTILGANLPAGDPVVSILQRARIVGDNATFRFERPDFATLTFQYRTIQT